MRKIGEHSHTESLCSSIPCTKFQKLNSDSLRRLTYSSIHLYQNLENCFIEAITYHTNNLQTFELPAPPNFTTNIWSARNHSTINLQVTPKIHRRCSDSIFWVIMVRLLCDLVRAGWLRLWPLQRAEVGTRHSTMLTKYRRANLSWQEISKLMVRSAWLTHGYCVRTPTTKKPSTPHG